MMEFTAEMIAGFLGGEVIGDKNAKVHTVSSIEEGKAGSLTYLTNPKYEPFVYTTGASIVLVDSSFTPSRPVAALNTRSTPSCAHGKFFSIPSRTYASSSTISTFMIAFISVFSFMIAHPPSFFNTIIIYCFRRSFAYFAYFFPLNSVK